MGIDLDGVISYAGDSFVGMDLIMIEARITQVTSVRPLGNNLSVITVKGSDFTVVANRTEDGSFRWQVNEPVVYVPEGAIVPDDVLQERGYWDAEKNRGLLEGKKHNRVKMRRFGPEDDRVESRGLLFKIENAENLFNSRGLLSEVFRVRRGERLNTDESKTFSLMGEDVAAFLGLTESGG